MSILQILILAVVQGLAEMLPVSSSAHVIVAQKLMGLDPSAPEMTFLLVMLHTGTMFAALLYFGRRWLQRLSSAFLKTIALATVCTGILGFGLKIGIEKTVRTGEVESLFNNLPLIGTALLTAGLLIIYSGRKKTPLGAIGQGAISNRQSIWIGISQGLCLPFRGLSRSGTTISMGLLTGVTRELSEEFSFALAVVLTPPVVLMELKRLLKTLHQAAPGGPSLHLTQALAPGLIGMAFSFCAALIALRFLSRVLERGKWEYFGYYCLAFSAVVFGIGFYS
ncbi:MAG: undecaprenyl-diphosphate phosphatase [Oligoflexia bacterium]|nr:undecaprenyl-diphosphate phosphatase [Oligoflexia bacterium]